jgi:hypothetical protein
MAQEVPLDPLGDEWAGYRAIVTGTLDGSMENKTRRRLMKYRW